MKEIKLFSITLLFTVCGLLPDAAGQVPPPPQGKPPQQANICYYKYGQIECENLYWWVTITSSCGNNSSCTRNNICLGLISYGRAGVWDQKFDDLMEELPNPAFNAPEKREWTKIFRPCIHMTTCDLECKQLFIEPECIKSPWIPTLYSGFHSAGIEGPVCPKPMPPAPPGGGDQTGGGGDLIAGANP